MIRILTLALFMISAQANAKAYEQADIFKTKTEKFVSAEGSRYCFEMAPAAQSSDPTMTYANIVIGGQKGEPVFIKKDLLIEMNCDKKVGEVSAPAPVYWSDVSDDDTAAGS